MIKTFEQFKRSTIKPIYSLEEFKAICDQIFDIVSDYYDEDNIDDFIYSSDVEAQEQFIEDNEIDNLRVCQHCGKFIVEGYLYRDFETFCSEECFVNEYGRKTYDESDDDELYWTAWEG
jgi:hypothetical protein